VRVLRYEHEGSVAIGVREGDSIVPTRHTDMIEFIRTGVGRVDEREAAPIPLAACRVLAPVPHPSKMLFLGINFPSHRDEAPRANVPTYPWCFSKLPSSIIGPGDPIVAHTAELQVDYEVEFAIIFGKTARGVTRADALSYVFGYTVVNDVSARAVQMRDDQITTGKGFDTFCPMGPEIALCDEIPDPGQLTLKAYVNGEERQNDSAAHMLFDVPTLIEFFTTNITFYPGDIITSGTPGGVGATRNPSVFLQPGDTVDVVVDGIGRLSNPVTSGW